MLQRPTSDPSLSQVNPLAENRSDQPEPQPCTLVIFGGGGDLSRRKLLPAVYNEGLDGELPASFAVIGFALENHTDESYREFAREGIEKFSRRRLDPHYWPDFARQLHFEQGSFDDPEAYRRLKARLEELEPRFDIPANRISISRSRPD